MEPVADRVKKIIVDQLGVDADVVFASEGAAWVLHVDVRGLGGGTDEENCCKERGNCFGRSHGTSR